MATYVLMTKLAPDVARDAKHREAIGRRWKQEIEKKCPEVKFICHYALLGPYDFLDIYEAPNEQIAAKVSMITQVQGALQAESWTALPWTQFLEIMEEIA